MVEDGVKLQDAFDGIKSKDEDLENFNRRHSPTVIKGG